MTASIDISSAVTNLRFLTVLIIHIFILPCRSRYPGIFLYHTLSRNRSTPTDLIIRIQQWILQPADMNMNQLLECRDSLQNIWTFQCAEYVRFMLRKAKDDPLTSFSFTPSIHLFALELQEKGRPSKSCGSAFAMEWRPWTSGHHIQIVFDIFSSDNRGTSYAGNRSIYMKGAQVYFGISNQSVSVFGKWGQILEVKAKDFIDHVKISWYPVGYEITDIIIEK